MHDDVDEAVARAAGAIRKCDALLVAAGAGMGVDSGLPDFRGTEGFWRAYPAYGRLGLRFEQMANPRWFQADAGLAWGFYGHRLHLYRATRPHPGFAILRSWMQACPHGGFVFTSNVDGQFQEAGFAEEQVLECHGSIHWMQCTHSCGQPPWSAEGVQVVVDAETMRARPPLPRCPACSALARPNILMFGDACWNTARTYAQEHRFQRWRQQVPRDSRVVVIECGAGLAVPTVRAFSEMQVDQGATLVRINVRDPEVPAGQISLAMPSLEALRRIVAVLERDAG